MIVFFLFHYLVGRNHWRFLCVSLFICLPISYLGVSLLILCMLTSLNPPTFLLQMCYGTSDSPEKPCKHYGSLLVGCTGRNEHFGKAIGVGARPRDCGLDLSCWSA